MADPINPGQSRGGCASNRGKEAGAVDRQWAATVLTGSTWRDSAIAVREALRQGVALDVVAEQTGIKLAILHEWSVALDVYDSLDMTIIGEAVRSRLDEDGTNETLYALRQLPRDARSGAARYLLEHRLPAAGADGLIQAIKDCRRLGVREGFTCEPGNALAYQKWQMARCTALPDDRQRYLREGLELAETEAVHALLQQALIREMGSGPLWKDRAGWARPDLLPVRWVGARDPWPRLIPYYDDLHLLGRKPLPTILPENPDGHCGLWHDLPAGRYVAVPGWPEVARLRRPVAVSCAASAVPFLGSGFVAGEETVLLVIETCCGGPEAGAVFLERQGEAVRAVVSGAEEHPRPDALLGKVILVVRRMADGSTSPFAVVDDEADEDILG